MRLRLTIQKEIEDVLDRTCFTAEDFQCYFGDDELDDLIRITFVHDESYFLKIGTVHNKFLVEMAPGEISEIETIYVSSLDEAFSNIPMWASELRSELKAGLSLGKQVDELREIISEQLGSQTEDEEFTVEEINNLRSKFSDLEKRVRQLEKDQVITPSQLENFESGIEQVSEDLEYYPKSTWLRTAPNKIAKLVVQIGKSKEGRKVLSDGARKLLGLD